ncbi:MAG: tetratricopeptide repeat protein [Bacteroidales bacterium]|nr:tetratricopeptide repeat protein [Bacteroidales bacterium]
MFRKYFHIVLLILFASACSPYQRALKKHKNLSEAEKLNISTNFVEASRYKILNDMESAKKMYQEILERDPLHDASLYELAELKSKNKEFKTADSLYKLAVKLEPENYWYKLGYAENLVRLGKFQDAANQYRSVIEKNPQRYELYEYEAQCYIYDRKPEKAVELYDKLESIIGYSEEIGIQKYNIYKSSGNLIKAMDVIRSLADNFPENVQYNLVLIGWYMNTGRTGQAINRINAVLEVDSQNVLAKTFLADYYHISGKDKEGINIISSIISSENASIDEKIALLMNVYDTKSVYGDTSVVYDLLDKLVEVNSDEAKAWAMYADFLYADKKETKAVEMWKNALKFDKSKYPIWSLMLKTMYEKKQFDTLNVYVPQALEYFPSSSDFWLYSGVSNFYAKKYDKAIESLEMALSLKFDSKKNKNDTQYFLAKSYYKEEKYDLSDKMFEECLNSNPLNLNANTDYAYSLLKRNIDVEKASQLLDFEPSEKGIDFLHAKALLLFRTEKYKEAAEAYENIFKDFSVTDGELFEHYGDALYKIGLTDDAQKYWISASKAEGASKLIDKKISEKKYYE